MGTEVRIDERLTSLLTRGLPDIPGRCVCGSETDRALCDRCHAVLLEDARRILNPEPPPGESWSQVLVQGAGIVVGVLVLVFLMWVIFGPASG